GLERVRDEVRQRGRQRRAITVELEQRVRAVDDEMSLRRLDAERGVMHGAEQIGDTQPLAGAGAAREYEHVLHEPIEIAEPLDPAVQQVRAAALVARPALR